MQDILIATSISPRGIEAQRESLASWAPIGRRVVSLNSGQECATIREAFPEFEVVEVERSAMEVLYKPLVFIDDILGYFLKQPESHLLLVNSDLHLTSVDSFAQLIRSVDADLIFGQRLDVKSLDDPEGELFDGFDYFLFSKGMAGRYPRSTFCLGAPWWDHWVPLIACILGCKTYLCQDPIVRHVIHEVNYGIMPLGKLGEELDQRLIELWIAIRSQIDYDDPMQGSLARLGDVFANYFFTKRQVIASRYPDYDRLDELLQEELRLEMAHIMPVLTIKLVKEFAKPLSLTEQTF